MTKNESKFHETVGILVKAYLNDELEHMTCSACACGNIVANALGTKPARNKVSSPVIHDNNSFDDGTYPHWYNVVVGHPDDTAALDQISKTGYTAAEIIAIEKAFETAPGRPRDAGHYKGTSTDPVWMFNGLMAVCDVLADIHKIDLQTKESAKLMFVK